MSLATVDQPKQLDQYPGYTFWASSKITHTSSGKEVRVHPRADGNWVYLRVNQKRHRLPLGNLIARAHHGEPQPRAVLIHKDKRVRNDVASNLVFDLPFPPRAVRRLTRGQPRKTYHDIVEAAQHVTTDIYLNIPDVVNRIQAAAASGGEAFGSRWEQADAPAVKPIVVEIHGEEWRPVAGAVNLEVSDRGRLRAQNTHRFIHCPRAMPLTCSDLNKPFSYRYRTTTGRATKEIARMVVDAFTPQIEGALTRVDRNNRNDELSNLVVIP